MKGTITGAFGSATLDFPDDAQKDPQKVQAYIDNFEKNAMDIKSGKLPLPDWNTFSAPKPTPEPIPSQFTNRPTSFSDYANGSPEAAGKPAQDVLHLANNVARIPTQIPNSEIQAVQDAKSVPGLIGHALLNPIKAALDPFRSGPDRIQSPSETLQRMGVGNAPQTIQNAGVMPSMGQFDPNNMPSVGKDVTLPGAADQLGNMYEAAGNYLTGGVASKITPPNVSSAIQSGKQAALQTMERPATKSILESLGYDPKKISQRLPDNPTKGFIENNPMDVAQEMKSVDLLHHPEKAYINLKSGLDKFGAGIGRIKDKADFAGVRVPIGTVASDLKNELINDLVEKGKGSTTFDSKVNEIIPKLESAISRMAPDENGTVPFSHAANFKSDIQDLVKNWGQDPNLSSLGDIAKKAQSKVGNLLTQSDNVYGPALDRFEAPYSTLKKYEPMIKDAADVARTKASLPSGTNVKTTKYGIMHDVLNSVLSPKETLASKLPEFADRAANMNPAGPLPSRTPAMTESMYNPDTYRPENSTLLDKIAPLKEAFKQAATKEEKQRILKLIWDVNYKNKQGDIQ